jgi:hypothetical protein
LLRVGSRYVKRHSFTRLRDSFGCMHAEGRHEDSSTLNGDKHPHVGHEMYYVSYRDEFGEGILRKRLREAIATSYFTAGVLPNQGFPLCRFSCRAGCRMRVEAALLLLAPAGSSLVAEREVNT